eukprot:evm.model.scf_1105.4 EVM.evm.TU.scf_1105.4   scf_1105:28267-31780(+)
MLLGKETPDLRSRYEFQGVLGQGSTAVVRKLVDKATGQEFACKSIAKRKLKNAAEVEGVKMEIEVLHHVSGHPNIATLHGVYEDKNNIHLVLDYCSGGELYDHVVERAAYSESHAADIMRTILKVVAHCHNLGVIHRDIKPDNFLWADPTQTTLKAIDFGLATFYKRGVPCRELVGSKFYIAPEVLKRSYSHQADVWSSGIVMYLMLTGLPPFLGDTTHEVFDKIVGGHVDFSSPPWPEISNAGKDCIKKMLAYHPRQRASAEQLLRTSWMREQGAAPTKPISSVVIDRVRSFAGMNRLQQVARKIVAQNLELPEIVGLKNLFESLDVDENGMISADELTEEVRKGNVNVSERELEAILRSADVDGDGRVDFHEFSAALLSAAKLQKEENLLRAFQAIDEDGSGYVTRDELEKCLAAFGRVENLEGLLEAVDKDGDGRIDYEEFREMMMHTGEPEEE